MKPGTHRELLVETIRDKLDSLVNAHVSFEKVKSHVENEDASEIEKVHNEIDKIVSRQMKSVRDQLVYPKAFDKDQRSVAVYIDRESCISKIDEATKLIEDLSGKGYFVSVAVEDNYFLDKVARKININNCKADIYLNEVTQDKKIIDSTPLYQYGMERALIRAFLNTKGINYNDFIRNASDTVINASETAASALLSRNLEFNEGMPQSIISITNPKSKMTINDVGYWFNSLSSHLYIKRLKYNKTIANRLGVSTGILPTKEIREYETGMCR